MGINLGSVLSTALRFNPITAAPMAAMDLLKNVLGGNNASAASSFTSGSAATGVAGTLLSILNPSQAIGRGIDSVIGQNLPWLQTPTVANVLHSSSLATSIAGTFGGGNVNSSLQSAASSMGANEASVVANLAPGVRDLYEKMKTDDPKAARAFLLQEMMSSLKIMGEMLSNVSKTRADIANTFARNIR